MLAASCRRKGDASGKIINVLNGEPVEGLTVNLEEYKLRMVSSKRFTRKLGETTTNSNGEFVMDYPAKIGTGYYRLLTIDEMHFGHMDTTAIKDIKFIAGEYPGCEKVSWDYKNHSRNDLDFYVAPVARIKIVPHNINHYFDNETMYVAFSDDNYSKTVASYNNRNLPVVNDYIQFPSNGKIYVYINIPSSMVLFDTIYVKPFDKITYHFNY